MKLRRVARSITLSQIFLYGGLVTCVIIRPAGLGANNGISYYGANAGTFFPFAIALLGAAYFTVRAIGQLDADKSPVIRTALKIYVPLIVGIVITPYSAGRYMDYLHTACGAALFFLQLVLSGWLVRQLYFAWWAIGLAVLEFIGGILSAIYLLPTQGFLLQAQVLFQLSFGVLLILSLQLGPARRAAAYRRQNQRPPKTQNS